MTTLEGSVPSALFGNQFFLAVLCRFWVLSSLTTHWTWALRSESMESQHLDHQGIPWEPTLKNSYNNSLTNRKETHSMLKVQYNWLTCYLITLYYKFSYPWKNMLALSILWYLLLHPLSVLRNLLTVWRFLKILEIELPYDPAIPLLGIHTKENQIWKRHVHPNVHRSTVYHSQDMEAT